MCGAGYCRANGNNRAVVRASDGAFVQITHFDRTNALSGKYPHIDSRQYH